MNTWPNIIPQHILRDGLAAVKLKYDAWGYINTSGTVVIPAAYWTASKFSEGVAVVSTEIGTHKYFIDKKGTKLDVTSPDLVREFKNGFAPAAIKENGKLVWGIYKNPLPNKNK